jgi:hypothetical protein
LAPDGAGDLEAEYGGRARCGQAASPAGKKAAGAARRDTATANDHTIATAGIK